MKLILDTNIVLDWLVFRDESTRELARKIENQQIVVVNSLVIDELRRVLAYPQFKLRMERQNEIVETYLSRSSLISMHKTFSPKNLLLPSSFPHCRDRDDQHFLALAYHAKADILVTRDKQVLALQGRAAKFGLRIADLKDTVERIHR